MKNIEIDKKILRNAGVAVGIAFVLISIWPFLVHSLSIRYWAAIVAGVLFFFALLAPQFIYWPYRLWMAFGAILGWVNTRVILSLLYFLVITPTGIIRKLFTTDTVNARIDKSLSTYKENMEKEEISNPKEQF